MYSSIELSRSDVCKTETKFTIIQCEEAQQITLQDAIFISIFNISNQRRIHNNFEQFRFLPHLISRPLAD